MESNRQQDRLTQLLKLAEQEKLNGNNSITTEKLNNLSEYIINYKQHNYSKLDNYPVPNQISTGPATNNTTTNRNSLKRSSNRFGDFLSNRKIGTGTSIDKADITNNPPRFSPLLNKYKLPPPKPTTELKRIPQLSKFKKIERTVIATLETVANLLDNLHLFSKLPMFPAILNKLLTQTNKLWVLILVFLLRKTISQLLNVIRKERKINVELNILKSQAKSNSIDSKLLDGSVHKKYEKVLKDLKFDKVMLILELIGNVMDLIFNVVEVFNFAVPDWILTGLNVTSMFMTIYRMNKDDEYIDDDITEDLI